MNVRNAQPQDIDSIVNIHLDAFEGFTLSLLGKRFLHRFYRAIINDDSGILLVAESQQQVVGFVSGTTAPEGYYKKLLLEQFVGFGFAALIGILTHPKQAFHLVKMVLSALTYRGDKPKDIGEAVLLSSIGVKPDTSSKGAGRLLLSAFEQQCILQHYKNVYLTTDRDGNERVNQFYRRSGYEIFQQIEKAGSRHMNVYVKALA